MVMRQLAYAASKNEYFEDWLFFAMIDLWLIDELACDRVQNLAIHLLIERKQPDILKSLLGQIWGSCRDEYQWCFQWREKECPNQLKYFTSLHAMILGRKAIFLFD